MKISVFGLGYVGAVSAGCLANDGHTLIGVDPNRTKVDLINRGKSPIIEKDLEGLIEKAVGTGRLKATTEAVEAVAGTDLSLICVGTPSQLNGNLDLRFVRSVCEEIGRALQKKKDFHVVVSRSTMLPGSMKQVVIPTLEAFSQKAAGEGFGVGVNPEFLREGTAVHDFYHPPKTVIGETDPHSGDLLADLFAKLEAPLLRTSLEVAEMVKYTDNVWHAIKICFANEIGNLCKSLSIDSHQVMDIFCQDTKLNLSPYYLKPGFAFGGSCLPKDVRALTYMAKMQDLDLPILNSILLSNEHQIEQGLKMVMNKGHKKVGVLGFSFKEGTDDLRESPMVEIIERLIGKGYDIRVHDQNVRLASLVGANRDFILNRIPHISRLMVETVEEILTHADTVVVGTRSPEYSEALHRINSNQTLVDLVRITNQPLANGAYDGICW